ncbi:MAG: helix-turn-helix domain-containing protein [Pseudomonadales bacterium]|nr:helix-turn-helix domain-containing protein [Pseudomonadales bacterium]
MISHITIVCYDQMLGSSVYGPVEMLSAAYHLQKHSENDSPWRAELGGLSVAPIEMAGGLLTMPTRELLSIEETDLIVLPAIWGHPKRTLKQFSAIIPWLRERSQSGSLICAVSTGCCFLAEAGLLDRKPATTHWYYFDRFARDYPKVQLQKKFFITQAENLYCAASINSLADLMVHVIERSYGSATARSVERQFSPEIRRPFESISFSVDEQTRTDDEMVIQSLQWLHDNYSEEVLFSQLADDLEVSLRTFNRRFKQATQRTPMEYLQKKRLDVARDLLKNTNMSIGEVGAQVGYGNLAYFSKIFKKRLMQSPGEYRNAVRAKLFSVVDQTPLA